MAWTSERTEKDLHAICPHPTKKTLKIHRGLDKAASALIDQIQMEKIGLKKFLYSKKVPGFDSLECSYRQGLKSAKHLLVKWGLLTQKKNRMWEKDRRKVAFRRIS